MRRPDSDPLAALRQADPGPTVVTIGTFDGVHAGHRALVARTADEARARRARAVAVTFSPRPDLVVGGGAALPDICPLDERVRRLGAAGADAVVVVPFDATTMTVTAATFVDALVDGLGAIALCVGADFALGHRREGSIAALRALGLEVVAVPLVAPPGAAAKISSSAIRGAIARGASPERALDDAALAGVGR